MAVQIFEGTFWQAKIESSNRWGNRIEFTSVSGDGYFKVPESRIESTIERLESGENPDIVAQSFPIDEPPKRGRRAGFSPLNGEDGAMIKKNKAWSMPSKAWEWLESQPNQSEYLRKLIEADLK